MNDFMNVLLSSIPRALPTRRLDRMCRRNPATMWPPHDKDTCSCAVSIDGEARRRALVEGVLDELRAKLRRFDPWDLAELRAIVEHELERRGPLARRRNDRGS